ncbi:MmcB family DNA repair protein [Geminicoccus roseus]|uniref:MmcB family DNA repair protein n=1 Tax=Geminicoccus roseus TaxID=404900 RepID=UPI00041CDE5D|nr:MmcB family DNA repair protein [Geminicoccus roseus]
MTSSFPDAPEAALAEDLAERPDAPAPPGRPAVTAAVCRGVLRHLVQAGHAPLVEMPLPDGRRADIMALGPDGRITIIEIKSCPADYLTDRKWQAYAAFCDRFGFAVAADFPLDLLPPEPGILVADAYDAAEIRPLQDFTLASARRRVLHLRFARLAALRTLGAADALAG